ncbi:Aryl-alcohol dehydrogenase [NADP(+)] [Trametes pubescens]|uniref:Aryl-alcohol dehydrogenase [NADP(+)] n=1 Tax=Trametes pubescens TaxID=154538 RepID=A0A1M2W649_TRAPU|nr:Aryl-alcohol dehydrogenase [NADP(+)] [Trametes pubescens]
MVLAPWNVLPAGKIRTDAEEASRREAGEKGRATFVNGFDVGARRDVEDGAKVLEGVASGVGAASIQAGAYR